MSPDQQPDGNVTPWRLSQVERQVAELMTRSEGWHNNLGAQITALSNQIGTTLAALPTTYAPRPEAEERHRAITDRFDDLERRWTERTVVIDRRLDAMDKRQDTIEARGWQVISGLAIALIVAVIGLLRTVPALHP